MEGTYSERLLALGVDVTQLSVDSDGTIELLQAQAVRCRELDRCFAAAMAAREKSQPPPQSPPQITAEKPPLVNGPTLVREGAQDNAPPPLVGYGAGKPPAGKDGGH